MLCKNCGAELEDDVLECPFCLSENSELSDKIYEKEVGKVIGRIQNVKEETKEEGRKISKKSGKVFVVSVIVLIGIIIISYTVSEIFSAFQKNAEKKAEERFLKEIDVLYQNGDYEGLSEYYYDKNIFSFKADKYYEVILAWRDMAYIREYKNRVETGDYVFPIVVYAILEDYNELSELTEEKTSDNAVRGNENIFLDFRTESETFLSEILGMTEQEIKTVREAQIQKDTIERDETLMNIADGICNRLGIKEEY